MYRRESERERERERKRERGREGREKEEHCLLKKGKFEENIEKNRGKRRTSKPVEPGHNRIQQDTTW
jgi:hypothetical protein